MKLVAERANCITNLNKILGKVDPVDLVDVKVGNSHGDPLYLVIYKTYSRQTRGDSNDSTHEPRIGRERNEGA